MAGDGEFQELGLSLLTPHPPDSASIRLDVIFVSGFGAQSVNNWRSLWPLNGSVGTATEGGHIRAFTFTYYEAPVRPYREEELLIFSENLLSQLDNQRKNLRDRFRPLVFIGHSVGGIIIKKALLCAQINNQFREILSSTLGVIFFATPHCSSPDGGSWLEIASNIFEASPLNYLSSLSSGKFMPHPSDLMTEEDSDGLDGISRGFSQIPKLRLVNFVEEENLLMDKLVVPRKSAKLVVRDSQILEVQSEGSHFEVCKSIGTEGRHGFKQLIHDMEHNSPKAPRIQSWIQQTDALLSLGVAEICQQNVPIRAVEGTCNWIRERKSFENWHSGAKHLLWVRGNMGCGKTYLSKYIKGLLSREPKKQLEDILAYCSIDQINERHKTPKSVLLCLLQDILIARRNLVQEFLTGRRALVKGERDIRDWPFRNVAKLWKDVVGSATGLRSGTRLTLIIDGIDQIVDHEELGSFYECITAAGLLGRVRILVLSRPHGDLVHLHARQGFSIYDITSEDSQVDIELVVNQRLRAFARARTYDDDLEHHLGEQIKGKAFGMWRWADMALSEVSSGELSKDPESLRRIELPPGMVALYDLILKRLFRSKHPTDPKFPQHVLFWMTHQLQPLDEGELLTALEMVRKAGLPQTGHQPSLEHNGTVNPETADIVYDRNRNLEQDILKYCYPLVRALPGVSILGLPSLQPRFDLVHRSLQVCLRRPTREISPAMSYHHHFYCTEEQAHEIIGTLCMDYLLLSLFDDAGGRYSEMERDDWLDKVAARISYQQFVKYAARHWIEHGAVIVDTEHERGSREHRLLDPNTEHGLSWFEVWWCLVKLESGEEFPRQLDTPRDLSQCLPGLDLEQTRRMEQHGRKRAQREAADLESNDKQQVQSRERTNQEHDHQLSSWQAKDNLQQADDDQVSGNQQPQQGQFDPPQTIQDRVAEPGFQDRKQGARGQAAQGKQTGSRQGTLGGKDARGKAAHQRVNRDQNVHEQHTHRRAQQDTDSLQLNPDYGVHDTQERNTRQRRKQGQERQWGHGFSEQPDPDGQQHTLQEPLFQELNDQESNFQEPSFQEINTQGPNFQQATQRSDTSRRRFGQQSDGFQAKPGDSLFDQRGQNGRNSPVHTKPGRLEREPDYNNQRQSNRNANQKSTAPNADQKEADQGRYTQDRQGIEGKHLTRQQDIQDRDVLDRGSHPRDQQGTERQHFTRQQGGQDSATRDRGHHGQGQQGVKPQHFTREQSVQDSVTQNRGGYTQDQQRIERQRALAQQDTQDWAAQDYLRGPQDTEHVVKQRQGRVGLDRSAGQDIQDRIMRDYVRGPQGAEQQTNQKQGQSGEGIGEEDYSQQKTQGPGARQHFGARHREAKFAKQEDHRKQGTQTHTTQRQAGQHYLNNWQKGTQTQRRTGEGTTQNAAEGSDSEEQVEDQYGNIDQPYPSGDSREQNTQRQSKQQVMHGQADKDYREQDDANRGQVEGQHMYNNRKQATRSPDIYDQPPSQHGIQQHPEVDQGQPSQKPRGTQQRKPTDLQQKWFGQPAVRGVQSGQATYQRFNRPQFTQPDIPGGELDNEGILDLVPDQNIEQSHQQRKQHGQYPNQNRNDHRHFDFTKRPTIQEDSSSYSTRSSSSSSSHTTITNASTNINIIADVAANANVNADVNATANTSTNTNTNRVTHTPAPKSAWRAAATERTASRWRREEARKKEEKKDAISKAVREQMEKRRREEQQWNETMVLKRQAEMWRRLQGLGRV